MLERHWKKTLVLLKIEIQLWLAPVYILKINLFLCAVPSSLCLFQMENGNV